MLATYPASRHSQYLHFYYARRVGHVIGSYTTHTLRRVRLMLSRDRDPHADLARWLNSEKPH